MQQRHHSQRLQKGASENAIFLWIFLAAVLAGLGLFGWHYQSKTQSGSLNTQAFKSILVYPKPKRVEEFALKNADGTPFTRANLTGKWSVLAFGFTTCPDICPTTMSEIKIALQSVALPPQVVLISVDPERDTPKVLSEYVAFFDSKFLGVTGDIPALTAFASNLGALFEKETNGTGPMDYTMAHTATIYLIAPDGNLAALIRPGAQNIFDWAQIRKDLPQFLKTAGGNKT
jgi:protein SCO1